MKIHWMLSVVIAVALPFSVLGADQDAVSADKHFDPLGKPPSAHTLKAIEKDSAGLPFSDTRDFDEAAKGFIAEPDSWKVLGPEGNVVWDLHRYDFFRTDTDFPSVHPSLQRVSRLNMKVGLFEVKPGFYQVRDPLRWSKNINRALYRYGQNADSL